MALDRAFVGLVKACFDEHGNILAWLDDEGIRTAEDYALLASDERDVDTNITLPAKTAAAHENRLKDKVAFKNFGSDAGERMKTTAQEATQQRATRACATEHASPARSRGWRSTGTLSPPGDAWCPLKWHQCTRCRTCWHPTPRISLCFRCDA